MNQKLKKISTIKSSRNHNRTTNERVFNSVECPSCSADRTYQYWERRDSIGHCPDCGIRWIEGDGVVLKVG